MAGGAPPVSFFPVYFGFFRFLSGGTKKEVLDLGELQPSSLPGAFRGLPPLALPWAPPLGCPSASFCFVLACLLAIFLCGLLSLALFDVVWSLWFQFIVVCLSVACSFIVARVHLMCFANESKRQDTEDKIQIPNQRHIDNKERKTIRNEAKENKPHRNEEKDSNHIKKSKRKKTK